MFTCIATVYKFTRNASTFTTKLQLHAICASMMILKSVCRERERAGLLIITSNKKIVGLRSIERLISIIIVHPIESMYSTLCADILHVYV